MTIIDKVLLSATSLVAAYLLYRFWNRYMRSRGLYDVYYGLGFLVLLSSCLLLTFLGYGILPSPYVLTVSSLIPLGISMGIAEQFFPAWKRFFKWFALIGILSIAVTSIGEMTVLRKIAVPVFHGTAGIIIILGPFLAQVAPRGFQWVGIGGLLISLGGVSLAFISAGTQLLFFSREFVLQILAGLLLLMSLAFAWGFMQDIKR